MTLTALALSLSVAAMADETAKAQPKADRSPRAQSAEALFTKYDANKDGQVTADEYRGGKTLFEAYDANKDGVLTRDEVKNAKPAHSRPSFRSLDTDKDGFVHRREWTGTQEEFDEADVDRDGVWSKADVAMEKARIQAKGEIERLDTDKNGTISVSEWEAAQRDAGSFRTHDLNRNGALDLDELATPPAKQ